MIHSPPPPIFSTFTPIHPNPVVPLRSRSAFCDQGVPTLRSRDPLLGARFVPLRFFPGTNPTTHLQLFQNIIRSLFCRRTNIYPSSFLASPSSFQLPAGKDERERFLLEELRMQLMSDIECFCFQGRSLPAASRALFVSETRAFQGKRSATSGFDRCIANVLCDIRKTNPNPIRVEIVYIFLKGGL